MADAPQVRYADAFPEYAVPAHSILEPVITPSSTERAIIQQKYMTSAPPTLRRIQWRKTWPMLVSSLIIGVLIGGAIGGGVGGSIAVQNKK